MRPNIRKRVIFSFDRTNPMNEITSKGQKRKRDAYECGECNKLLYRPHSFGCGHSICAACNLKGYTICPECEWSAPTDFVMRENRDLALEVSTLKPEEYSERRKEFKDIKWVFKMKKTLSGFSIYFDHSVGLHKAVELFKAIDDADAWVDPKELRNLLSDTCSVIQSQYGRLDISMCGGLRSVIAMWDNGMVYICNASDNWYHDRSK